MLCVENPVSGTCADDNVLGKEPPIGINFLAKINYTTAPCIRLQMQPGNLRHRTRQSSYFRKGLDGWIIAENQADGATLIADGQSVGRHVGYAKKWFILGSVSLPDILFVC